jgi:hypothetical protein
LISVVQGYTGDMDKPKQRGTNKPKSFSPSRQEKQMTSEIRAKRDAEQSKRLGGAKPPPQRLRRTAKG